MASRVKKIKVMTNSVDMMLKSGLRTIHANPKSKRDLQDGRKALLKMGYVNKANFIAQNHEELEDNEVDEADYRKQLRSNPAVQRVKQLQKKKIEGTMAETMMNGRHRRIKLQEQKNVSV